MDFQRDEIPALDTHVGYTPALFDVLETASDALPVATRIKLDIECWPVVLHIQEASWRFHGGIAFMTNMLLTKQQIHQARLTEHLTVFDAWRLTNTGRSAWRAKLHLSASTGQRPKAGFRTRLPLDSRPGSDAGVQRHLFPAHRCDARDDPVISVPSGAKDYRWRGATRRVNFAPF